MKRLIPSGALKSGWTPLLIIFPLIVDRLFAKTGIGKKQNIMEV
jgi:hypothetical protein